MVRRRAALSRPEIGRLHSGRNVDRRLSAPASNPLAATMSSQSPAAPIRSGTPAEAHPCSSQEADPTESITATIRGSALAIIVTAFTVAPRWASYALAMYPVAVSLLLPRLLRRLRRRG